MGYGEIGPQTGHVFKLFTYAFFRRPHMRSLFISLPIPDCFLALRHRTTHTKVYPEH